MFLLAESNFCYVSFFMNTGPEYKTPSKIAVLSAIKKVLAFEWASKTVEVAWFFCPKISNVVVIFFLG